MAGLFELLAGQFGIINLVRSSLALDVAASDIIAKAAEQFSGISAEKVSNIIDFFQNQQPAAQEYLLNLNRNEVPDITQLLPPLVNQLSNFSYTVQVNGTVGGTQLGPPQYVTVISQNILTKRQAAQIAFSKVASNTSASYSIQPINADVINITYAGGGTSQQVFGPSFTEGYGHGLF